MISSFTAVGEKRAGGWGGPIKVRHARSSAPPRPFVREDFRCCCDAFPIAGATCNGLPEGSVPVVGGARGKMGVRGLRKAAAVLRKGWRRCSEIKRIVKGEKKSGKERKRLMITTKIILAFMSPRK